MMRAVYKVEITSMLIHVTPRLLNLCRPEAQCSIVSIEIPEFGLRLLEGKDLACGRPYPNKTYLVARRRGGRRAIAGLMLDVPRSVEGFAMKATWSVDGVAVVHRVEYRLAEKELDMATDLVMLWRGLQMSGGKWGLRWPAEVPRDEPPVRLQPRMDVGPTEDRPGIVTETVGKDGVILERVERLVMPTIERDRFDAFRCTDLGARLPQSEDAIACK